MVKQVQFWICAVFAGVLFWLLFPISVSTYTSFAWYVHIFNAISAILFAAVLYKTLMRSWTNTWRKIYMILVGLSSLPHILFSVLSYGSWVCLLLSWIILLCLIFCRKRPKEE